MPALESLIDAVRELEAELEQARHHLTPTPQNATQSVADDGIRHGTLNGYTTHRCRCDECSAANTAYMREYQARRKAKQAT